MKTKANLTTTLDQLGSLFDKEGGGAADLSNLRHLLESREHVPLEVYFAQLKADVKGEGSVRNDNGKGAERLNRMMAR